MIKILRILLAVFLLAGFFLAPAIAQTSPDPAPVVKIDKRKLLVQPRNAEGSIIMVSFWEDPALWVRDKQQEFYGAMSVALRAVKTDKPYMAAGTLMLLSFAYGIFHAAGPGHGKTVISAWLLATENELKRGILIAFMSSIIQAVVAVSLVSVLLLVVASAGRAAKDMAGFLESGSYAMIAALGIHLLWTAIRPFTDKLWKKPASNAAEEHSASANYRAYAHQPANCARQDATHVHDEHCGHVHVADVKQVQGDWSPAKALSLSFAIGIRPCTGSLLVLIVANALGIYWAGIVSTVVMSLGTFLTVAVIAAIAVYSKKLALRLASRDGRWVGWLSFGLRSGGGLAIACLGGLLFLGSLGHSSGMM